MQKKYLPLFVCLILVVVLYLIATLPRRQTTEDLQRKHIGLAVFHAHLAISRLEYYNKPRHFTANVENSWRAKFVGVTPWQSEESTPGLAVPWQSEKWKEWDDDVHPNYCLKHDPSVPREKRYTGLMTVESDDSALQFIQKNGLEELLRVAPDTIFFVEVINSQVPWMQAGDLELATMPHSINCPDKLGIGSVYGYDQFIVGFVDKSIWVINSSIPFTELEKFLTVEDAKKYDREETLGPYGYEEKEFKAPYEYDWYEE